MMESCNFFVMHGTQYLYHLHKPGLNPKKANVNGGVLPLDTLLEPQVWYAFLVQAYRCIYLFI